jgi:hypothetical protein
MCLILSGEQSGVLPKVTMSGSLLPTWALQFGSEVLQRSTMSIAANTLKALRSSGAQCSYSHCIYIPLLTERVREGIQGYKHFAPPEQGENDVLCQSFLHDYRIFVITRMVFLEERERWNFTRGVMKEIVHYIAVPHAVMSVDGKAPRLSSDYRGAF